MTVEGDENIGHRSQHWGQEGGQIHAVGDHLPIEWTWGPDLWSGEGLSSLLRKFFSFFCQFPEVCASAVMSCFTPQR